MEKKRMIYVAIVVVLALAGALGMYMGIREFRKQKLNNELKSRSSEVEFVLYYVNWCPYCKKAKPIWDKVTSKYIGEETNMGKNMVFIAQDCEEDPNENRFIVNGKAITSYPTIYANNFKDPQVEFDSKCTEESLRMFIEEIKSKN
jgi:thiol-disulfide isomerase/thioredoxin